MAETLEIARTMVIGGGAAAQQPPAAEVVAGYALQERLGVGGYGEVWSAVGPGGLRKAVKILHGKFDDPQAHVEMRALRSVRELRHPFLLNVERAEVVGSRLIIVTELADRSLQDRFHEACRQGLRGIPRDELIGYLRDAADALDFIFEVHGLQHLDIKPENLLLQGTHIKVGDLGLIKDVRSSQASLINGFTALYAAPEIFEGHASGASDQYSLAIVYQQMLTGTPPFSGRTAAQLTAQHLKGTPQLAVLAPGDRKVVARALSKVPKARFPNCKQFVEELANCRSRIKAAARPAAPPRPESAASAKPSEPAEAPGAPLPATVAPQDRGLRPTVVVGLGGFAERVLRDVARRVTDQQGALENCPALQILAIDSDTRAAPQLGRDAMFGGETPVDAMAIPLRQAKDYRAASGDLLEWLSRRWLFNIPRSRQVEGIRPLGRLALVDHHQEIRSRIRAAIQAACAGAVRLARSGDSRFPHEGEPLEVVVVASISGGTGSGGVLDLAYLVRDVVNDLRLPLESLVGILACGTGLGDRLADVQNANALACLMELRHILATGLGYPGDRACQLPATDAAPFDHAYLVHMGDGLGDEAFQREARALGRYLFCNVATQAGAWFRTWRRLERAQREARAAVPTLRAVSVAIDEPELEADRLDEAARTCRAAVARWAADARHALDGKFAGAEAALSAADALLNSLHLTKAALSSQLNSRLRGETNQRLESYLQEAWPRLLKHIAGGAAQVEAVFAAIDAELEPRGKSQSASAPARARDAIDEIRRWLLGRLDAAAGGCTAARAGLLHIVSRLQTMLGEWQQVTREMNAERQLLLRDAAQGAARHATPAELAEALKVPCLQYCMLHFCQQAYQGLVAHVGSVAGALADLDAELSAFVGRLVELEGVCSDGRTRGAQRGPKPADGLVQGFEEMLREKGIFRLSDLWSQQGRLPVIAGRLHRAALDFVARRARPMSAAGDDGHRRVELPLVAELAAARLAHRGGGRRVMAFVPEQREVEPLERALTAAFGACAAVVADDGQPPCVCYEVEGLPVDGVIEQMALANPHLPEMAARLKTRVDINW